MTALAGIASKHLISGPGMDQSRIDLARRRIALSHLIGKTVKLRRVSGAFVGLCPFHREKTPSFYVYDTSAKFKCYGCGERGDAIDFVMLTQGLSFGEAVGALAGTELIITSSTAKYLNTPARGDDDTRRIAHAHSIWLKRQPIIGTLAERYLATTRAIPGPYPDLLGYARHAYCSVLGEETEALIAPIQNSAGHVTAVQQIFLCRETDDAWRDDKGKRVKRTLGAMQDGCVRLGLPDTTLGLAGSCEDALAASSLYSLPVWATCGEQRMARVWVPEEIEQVVIFADADDAGLRAATEAKATHQRAGRRVTIMMPGATKDFAETVEKRAAV